MINKTVISICSLVFLLLSACAKAEDTCNYLPEFQEVRKTLPALPAMEKVSALEKYYTDYENPLSCEMFKIFDLLNEYEKPLFKLQSSNSDIDSQQVTRCNRFDDKTAQCSSPMQDTTAHHHTDSVGIPDQGVMQFSLTSAFKKAKLLGVYTIPNADILDGKPATRLTLDNNRFTLDTSKKHFVLIAIYKTDGPWDYRKAVWFF